MNKLYRALTDKKVLHETFIAVINFTWGLLLGYLIFG